jgi:hypothetical protein
LAGRGDADDAGDAPAPVRRFEGGAHHLVRVKVRVRAGFTIRARPGVRVRVRVSARAAASRAARSTSVLP